MRNMAVRAASVSSGMMDAGEYELNREKLTKWLVALFSGENPHFESDAEWHRGGGLAQYLREAMNAPFAGEREVLRRACEQFSAEADELARDFTETGGSAAALEQRSQAVIRWAHIFTGAPEAF